MRILRVQLPIAAPVRVGPALVAPEWVGTAANARAIVPRWLRGIGAACCSVEEWELITLDQRALRRAGTMDATGAITWGAA